MAYALRDLLADTLKKRGPLAGAKDTSDYQEVWDAYNRYATAQFREQKGLQTTNFCKLGWQVERRRSSGQPVLKPYFQLAESFCKGFGVDAKQSIVPEKDLCPMEELNFSKAAIRFSSKLTKDQMFSGLRYMVQQLGESIGKGRQVNLEFEMGKLVVHDKKARFSFAAAIYTKHGLQVPADALETIDYAPSITFAPPSEDALSLRLDGQAHEKAEADKAVQAVQAQKARSSSDRAEAPAYAEQAVGPPSRHSRASRSTASTYDASVASSGARSDVENKQAFAYKEALDRHITEMEIRASEAVKERSQWEEHISRCLEQEKMDFEQKRVLEAENADYLHQQMRWNEESRHDQRRHMVDAASAHDFPHFSEPPQAELDDVMKQQQQKFRSDLDFQVRTNNALRNMARSKERELENSQVDANVEEMKQIRMADKARKDADKHALTQAWNQDIRMKGIWRAIENHCNAAGHAETLEGAGPFGDGVSVASSRGASSRARKTPIGASQSLAQQREKLKQQQKKA